VTPCRWASSSRRFERLWRLHVKGQTIQEGRLDPEDEGITILSKVSEQLAPDTRRHITEGFNV
jgi:hypothetical protein